MKRVAADRLGKTGSASGFVTRVAFVLSAVDDLTNRQIGHERIRALIPGYPPPIYKSDGWICFTGLLEGEYTVILTGSLYQTKTIKVQVTDRKDGPCPVMTVRMMPGPGYPLPKNCVSIAGKAVPGSSIRAVFKPEGSALKLLYNYESGRIIRLFSQDMKVLDGRCFVIGDREYFTITETLDENERVYMMDRELEKSYKKGTSKIYLTGQATADEKGDFYMAVRCFGRGKTRCRIGMNEGEQDPLEISIKPGDRVDLSLQDPQVQ